MPHLGARLLAVSVAALAGLLATGAPASATEYVENDMSIKVTDTKAPIGSTVRVTAQVRTAGVERYSVGIEDNPEIELLTTCDRRANLMCWFERNAVGKVDTMRFDFKVRRIEQTNVVFVVQPVGETDPNPRNNLDTASIIGAVPTIDMAVEVSAATGKVGDIVTVPLTLRTHNVDRYLLSVKMRPGVKLLTPCTTDHKYDDIRICEIEVQRTRAEIELRFRIEKAGRTDVFLSVSPFHPLVERAPKDNIAKLVITGTEAGQAGDGLPVTGSRATALAVGGVGLLATGLLLAVASRRRRPVTR